MGRAPCCDKANVKRGPWSPEEDAALKSYMEKNAGSVANWIALPPKAGLRRCGKSCRLRWLNYLRPDIKHGSFTAEEDDVIFNLYSSIGSRWSVIASHLPGRTDNDVKNYWNTKLKKKKLPGGAQQQTAFSSNPSPPSLALLPPPPPALLPLPKVDPYNPYLPNMMLTQPMEDVGSSTNADEWSVNDSNSDYNVGDLFFSEFASYSELLGGGFGLTY